MAAATTACVVPEAQAIFCRGNFTRRDPRRQVTEFVPQRCSRVRRGILGRGPRQRQLSEPGNEANNERGERGDNVGEQLLLSQPPPRRLLLLLVPDRTGLALFDLPDAQTFELPAPGAPLSPSCHLASHLLGLPVPQKLFSGQLAAVGRGPAALRRIR